MKLWLSINNVYPSKKYLYLMQVMTNYTTKYDNIPEYNYYK